MEEKLYMPSNIETEKEIIIGISTNEVKYLVSTSGISIIIGIILGVVIKMEAGVISIVIGIIGSYAISSKTTSNRCIAEIFISVLKFYKSQNLYKYKYVDEWSDILKKEETNIEKKKQKNITANEFINVANIKDDVLFTKNDKALKYIKLEPVSISTMSKTDIKLLLKTLTSEVNSYDKDLRFFKISKPVDISKLILDYKDMYRKTVDLKQKELLRGATSYLQRHTTVNELENNFYIIVSGCAKDIEELNNKENDIRRKFLSAKIGAEICETKEIIRICDLFANPNYRSVENIENDISIIRDFVGGDEFE